MISIKKNKGFTLLELLVVVLIIGLLATIAGPVFIRSVEESRSSEATTNLSTYAYSQERYFFQFGSYSTTPRDLDATFNDLTYFTITQFGQSMTLERKVAAGGQLGKWSITMTLPATPGSGRYLWDCNPRPACNYLIPSGVTAGSVNTVD